MGISADGPAMTRYEPDREAHFAASCLRMIGYDVCPVPRTIRPGGSCDLDATCDRDRLLIEVKTWKTPRRALDLLAQGEAAPLGGRVDRNDRDLPKLTKATRQLAASAKTIDAAAPLQVAWFRLNPPGDQHPRLRMFSALYGVQFRRIIAGPRLCIANLVPCFQARRPGFRDMLNVSGVVVESLEGVGLWTNRWSNDTPRLLESHLCQTLRRFSAVFHLAAEEVAQPLYVVEGDPANEEEVAASLKRKYGVTTVPSPDGAPSTSTAWPGSECGRYTPIPGADRVVPHWQLAVDLWNDQESGV